MVAANTAVNAPISATTIIAASDSAKTGKNRPTRNTPAATIVAAWISALTGVGPSMASGSQVCNGNWPLLPAAPANRPRHSQSSAPPATMPAPPAATGAAASQMCGMCSAFSPWAAKSSAWKNR